MRRFKYLMTLLRTGGVLSIGLFVVSDLMAQPPVGPGGPGGPGGERRPDDRGGRGGRDFGGRGFGGMTGEASFSREMRRESFASKLNLTEEQKQLINEIDMERNEYFRSMPRGFAGPGTEEFEKRMQEVRAKFAEYDAKAIAILTPEQKAIWEERKAEVKKEFEAMKPPERPRTDTPSVTTSEPKEPARRTVFTDEKPPEGTAPTASFAPRVASAEKGTNVRTETGDVPPADDTNAKPASAEPRLSFNFRYAPWADVLKLFAEAAGLTLDLNDVPPGTFNYFDDKTYTVTEALDVLNGYLLPKGYVLVRRDRFLVSIDTGNGIPPSLLPTISVEDLPKHGANELVIVDIPLEGFEADKIVAEVKELAGPWSKVAALKNTNTLNIMDTGSNISRIIRLLKSGAPVDNRETSFRAVPLKHISAAEAERTVRRLFGLNTSTTQSSSQQQFGFQPFGGFNPGFPGGFGGFRGGDGRDNRDPRQQQPTPTPTQSTPSQYAGKIQVTSDPRTNHLLITASASLVKVVEEVVKSIDVDKNAAGDKIVANDSPAFLKAYVVAGGDVVQVSRTLNSMMPGLVVGEDTKSGKIHVQASREEHAEIEKLIQTLAGEASGSVAVINLTKLDPIQATNTLRNLFVNDARAPMIEADALGRRLLVRGSADQLAQVKIILQQLGESGPTPENPQVDRGRVRTLNSAGRAPDDVLPLLQKMWEAGDNGPIRVVVPSRPNPIRDRRVPSGRKIEDQEPDNEAPPARPATPVLERPSSGKTSSNQRTEPEPQRRSSILQVSQSGEGRDSEAPRRPKRPAQSEQAPSEQPEKAQAPTESENGEPAQINGGSAISISVVGDEVIISSDDTKALDQFEDMYNALAASMPMRTRWTVFYLRTADATDTAQMLERLFPQSTVTASTTSSTGMLGSLTGGLSTLGRGMMNATGLNQTLGGANDLRIITDIRANALFVTGPREQIAEVEAMLELLDSSELPESLRDRVPRSIPIEFAEVDDVADIVESVFKDSMTPDPQAQQGGNGQRFNPLAMLMGGGQGGSGGRKDPGVQLSIGVDRRTSHLIVACNESLFRQIESLVKSIDERARDARQTVRVMHLETADPTLVSSTLTSLIPKVTITATRGGANRKNQGEQPGGGAQPDAVRDPQLIQRMQQGQGSRNRGGGTGGSGQRPNFGNGGGGGGQRPNFGGGGGTNIPRPNGGGGGRGSR
ncbi:MAG: secretin N-terminal domain-containing protein [Planctomycetaceae bacterium]